MLDIFVISTIVLAVWGAIGPLVGVRYGHELAKKSQREHWVNDNAKQEYRELVSVLFQSANIAIANRTLGRETTQAENDKEFEADSAFLEAVNTRLFIRQFVEDAKIQKRWEEAFREHKEDNNVEALRSRLREMIQSIVDEATKLGK